MKRIRSMLAAGSSFLLASATLGAQGIACASSGDSASPERVVRRFVDAFNQHDVAAMLTMADSSVEWLSVDADSIHVETRGRPALERSMTAYFKQLPTTRSTLEAVFGVGPWISARERAEWKTAAGATRSQSGVSVYEVRGGCIRRVWYYPAVRP